MRTEVSVLPVTCLQPTTLVLVPWQVPGGSPSSRFWRSPRGMAGMGGLERQPSGTWGHEHMEHLRGSATVPVAAVGCGALGRVALMLMGDVKLFASQSRG